MAESISKEVGICCSEVAIAKVDAAANKVCRNGPGHARNQTYYLSWKNIQGREGNGMIEFSPPGGEIS